MSFDLFIFERRKDIKTSLDVFNYYDEFIEYKENKDYNSLHGCSDIIVAWAKKMFEKFPPMNGKYALSDEIAYASEDTENHLTDYSFGKNGVYCAFSYNVATEVLKFLKNTAEQYGMGVYNLATGEIFCENLDILKYSTESTGDTLCDWNTIENSIATLDIPERGIIKDQFAFITIWFENDSTASESNYIQCTPNYVPNGFFARLFNKEASHNISGYFFEIAKDDALYQTLVQDKNELKILIKNWCIERKEPDINTYKKILDL